ncbi:MAG: phospholipid carrier-dependent glycosyltransferase, partial [Coprothermobacterota bacterium]|nr:phospholipid carrier-dependent glycosyltransferase [Coprothermobacterota bacterium]
MTLRKQVILLILLILFAFLSRGLFLNQPAGTVFDEVHYVKAARAYVAGQPDTNWEHPPLGKMC